MSLLPTARFPVSNPSGTGDYDETAHPGVERGPLGKEQRSEERRPHEIEKAYRLHGGGFGQ